MDPNNAARLESGSAGKPEDAKEVNGERKKKKKEEERERQRKRVT